MERLEKNAIEILNIMCGNNGCVISDSGGKDSSVLKRIALKTHEKYHLSFKVRHNHTTVDAPETVYFVREEKKRKDLRQQESNMKSVIPKKRCGSL